MRFSLIVCTYMRPQALLSLLQSVRAQSLYPDEILIIDGSIDDATQVVFEQSLFKHLRYYKVEDKDRGLTKQRNFGIKQVGDTIDVVCFLDDDIVLEPDYFKHLISTYNQYPDALAVGGYITNEVSWDFSDEKKSNDKFYYDGFMRAEPLRFKIRRHFGLLPDVPPGFMPSFSHGRSVSFLPPSGKIYEVEQIMGGVSSYKKEVFNMLSFSEFFEGYGLYEDADFSLRIAKKGSLYINTNAKLAHYHNGSGRPNQFYYGKMVIENGWYVWRVKYPKPSFKAKFKWYATAKLLLLVRYSNIITSKEKKKALSESLGRTVGLIACFFNINKR
ncbi:glycosyltransferase involved in cell wall biosynthesis [Mesoflavibacter sabulilitoris]|uniref:Glycosyl transferase family 2 n=1 Tax=Mesoflavibacter zeaxanthinifaciens subsp. sabulilitoris TaxID=1520893 RepID=A0A2T1NB23_9FLAO|nr:glycosyltransferase family 2 protein [Mesoflavibacter zeaxanthinifaciens]MBB3123525.1 glycosyltransferase involved in cell wall biosynthesis [Mesoflavibacter zeaxanthinifaciens subsp. sabulilitoris]PSG89344.1 glycosyl transferase family 2 [Mesoflavibacter zeaxanthinifaciens subsp. sabulilitoris]